MKLYNHGKLIKQDIETIPFEEISELGESEFITRYLIRQSWPWLANQLLAYLGRYKLPERNENNKYDAKAFMKLNALGSDRELGLWRLLQMTRSSLMASQTLPEHLPVCSFVPIYMAAQKQYNNISYNDWEPATIAAFVEPKLAAVMLNTPPLPEDCTKEDLLEIRKFGIKEHDPKTYWRLEGIFNTAIGHMEIFAQSMITQIWLAHPYNRHKYMILDPWNWDHMPDPLIDSEPIIPIEKKKKKETTTKLPNWNDLPEWARE